MKKPTHDQARLQLQLYELRREPRMRQAREWFLDRYRAATLEEANRLTPTGSDESAFARMVTTYWDQACSFLNFGLLHEELFFENNGEFYEVWLRLQPFIAELRKRYESPILYRHLERAARQYEKWIRKLAPGWQKANRTNSPRKK